MARTGRPRAFDTAETLARARDIFWAAGYGATSIQDLVDGLAVERGSLYAAYGDKRRLYLDAVRLYWAGYEELLRPALATVPLLPALREILVMPAMMAEVAADPGSPHGCMMGNTAVELVPHDADATAVVTESYARFVELVAPALREAQNRGEVTDGATPEAQAQLLLILAQGTSLVARTGADPAPSIAALDAALAGLEARAAQGS